MNKSVNNGSVNQMLHGRLGISAAEAAFCFYRPVVFVHFLNKITQFKVVHLLYRFIVGPVAVHESIELRRLKFGDLPYKLLAVTVANVFLMFLLYQSFLEAQYAPVPLNPEHINDLIEIEPGC